jgi:hypothetical protein
MKPISQPQMERWITAPRFQAYLDACNGDYDQAIALYDWNVCLSAVFFEALSYVEVLLRNAIDSQFQPVNHSAVGGTWLHDPSLLRKRSREKVMDAEQFLMRERKTPTRARLVAKLTFGFWKALFDRPYDPLWRNHLYRAFPNGNGTRGEVAGLLSDLTPFRNRIAHHDTIINSAVQDRHDDLIELARLIDTDAARWVGARSCVGKILEWRPPLTPTKRFRASVGLPPRTVRFHSRAD